MTAKPHTPPVLPPWVVGPLMLGAAALLVRPAITAMSDGATYAALATDPFGPGNPNGHRVLTPLVAYLLGLRGDGILLVNLSAAAMLLGLVYGAYRVQFGTTLGVALAAAIAVSMTTLVTIYWGGYTDSTNYLLLVLMLIWRRQPGRYWACFLLGLLNRESVAFLLPFLVLLGLRAGQSRRALTAGPLAALGLYVLFRLALSATVPTGHTLAFYFAPLLADPFYWLRQSIALYPVGVFSAFRALWLLPVLATVVALRYRDVWTIVLLATCVLGAMAQSVLAVDTTRMLSLAFPALLLSAESLVPRYGVDRVSRGTLALVAVSVATPALYVTSTSIMVLLPWH